MNKGLSGKVAHAECNLSAEAEAELKQITLLARVTPIQGERKTQANNLRGRDGV